MLEIKDLGLIDLKEVCFIYKQSEYNRYYLTIVFKNGYTHALESDNKEEIEKYYEIICTEQRG